MRRDAPPCSTQLSIDELFVRHPLGDNCRVDISSPFRALAERLIGIDDLQVAQHRGVTHLLQDDHRWIIPAVKVAQDVGILERPCTVVLVDQHTDLEDCLLTDAEAERLRQECTMEDLVVLCGEGIRCNPKQRITDGNWIKTGMALGYFDHLVGFGIRRDEGAPKRVSKAYVDRWGSHRIELCLGRPVLPLRAHQTLADSRDTGLQELLGWGVADSGSFAPIRRRHLLSIDLDCFIHHKHNDPDEPPVPWTKRQFAGEFIRTTMNGPTVDWTGRAFMHALIERAGLVVLSQEAEMFGRGVGGKEGNATKAEQRFRDVIYDGGPAFTGLSRAEQRAILLARYGSKT
jgi:hypothetical protein